ncbi:morphogenetic protein [Serratia marcescens]|uniref:morphogenetic protein n=1 Tax=Serratia marcescens TaxID=615 RepID=UPI0029DC8735|nr:morphogenetic protein [Serratia marcescens]MDX7275307.1 morphogenetic protein [Serratia marcescens]
MKERPVIFNGEMVHAILDGRKTQTRRVINPQPTLSERTGFNWNGAAYGIGSTYRDTVRNFANCFKVCPFGQVGDRLWVRETWAPESIDAEDGSYSPDYRATANGQPLDGRWTPSIHMPRWASRILLEITGVRVERLNDISDGDAIREGCSAADMKSGDCVSDVFARLWSSIYGEESWRANPWVWVIEFRRVEVEK